MGLVLYKHTIAITLCNSKIKKCQPTGGSDLSQRKGTFIISQLDGDNHWASSNLPISGNDYCISVYLEPSPMVETRSGDRHLPLGLQCVITGISALGRFRFLWRLMWVSHKKKKKRCSHIWLQIQAAIPLRSFSGLGGGELGYSMPS